MPQFLDEYLSHTNVDLNLLVGVLTFTFSPLHCYYATIVEGGAADRRRRPILVRTKIPTAPMYVLGRSFWFRYAPFSILDFIFVGLPMYYPLQRSLAELTIVRRPPIL